MKLFKWKSTDLKPKFPNIIERFFGKKIFDEASQGEEISIVPSVNISDENKAFEVNVALPGLKKKDVNIEIRNNCLIISSEKKYENNEKNKNWIRQEYGYAAFQRMFQLPDNTDENKVSAKMKDGVLNIKVAKKNNYISSKKQISIE